MEKNEKTNVMRVLEQKKLPYTPHFYDPDSTLTGGEIADILGETKEKVFKTLVTVGKTKKNYVFMIPVDSELDLKKAAKACGEKSVDMIKAKELLPLTGYVHGGCSPIGMKKQFTTFAHATIESFDRIFFSGGRVGAQVEMTFADLKKAVPIRTAELTV